MECYYSPLTSPLTTRISTQIATPKIAVALDEILPGTDTPHTVRERAAYQFYIDVLSSQPSDAMLAQYRALALRGGLDANHFAGMNTYLESFKHLAMAAHDADARFVAYAAVNSQAMLLAQILFVDNLIKENFLSLLAQPTTDDVLTALCNRIHLISDGNGAALSTQTTEFYATLFVLQTAFDKLYVPDTDIVRYDTTSGRYSVTEHYRRYTDYLGLSGCKLLKAGPEEITLCCNITTGWSEGIDLNTWNALNTTYYSGLSATTGKENLFTRNYDRLLERMIPQFVVAKIRLADTILGLKQPKRPLKILEIGAGSGALAIDLIMAAKRRDEQLEQIHYVGIEPSEHMRNNFKHNCQHKIGDTEFPENWQLIEGSIESVTADPQRYLDENEDTLIVFSFSLHHCFADSVKAFFANVDIKQRARHVMVLDAKKGHGWTKPYYMWADCESPENFDNIQEHGLWMPQAQWEEPGSDQRAFDVDYGWCYLQMMQ